MLLSQSSIQQCTLCLARHQVKLKGGERNSCQVVGLRWLTTHHRRQAQPGCGGRLEVGCSCRNTHVAATELESPFGSAGKPGWLLLCGTREFPVQLMHLYGWVLCIVNGLAWLPYSYGN